MCYANSVLELILVYSLDSLIVDTIPSTCYEAAILVARVALDDYESIGSIFCILSQKVGAETDEYVNFSKKFVLPQAHPTLLEKSTSVSNS
jgi:hypothetical protein